MKPLRLKPNHRRTILLTLALLFFTAAALLLAAYLYRGLIIMITNAGPTPMTHVRVALGTKSVLVGDIAPHAVGRVRIIPHGDSAILITYTDPHGITQTIDAAIPIKLGDIGTVKLTIANGLLKSAVAHLHHAPHH